MPAPAPTAEQGGLPAIDHADLWIERADDARGWRIVDRATGEDLTGLLLDGCYGVCLAHAGRWTARRANGSDFVAFGGFLDHRQYAPGVRFWIKCALADFPNNLVRLEDLEDPLADRVDMAAGR